MDYSVFHLHLTQEEGNNKKIGLKNVLDPTLSGICASLYRHVLNCTFPKIFRGITVTPQKSMKQFSYCRLRTRNMHFRCVWSCLSQLCVVFLYWVTCAPGEVLGHTRWMVILIAVLVSCVWWAQCPDRDELMWNHHTESCGFTSSKLFHSFLGANRLIERVCNCASTTAQGQKHLCSFLCFTLTRLIWKEKHQVHKYLPSSYEEPRTY